MIISFIWELLVPLQSELGKILSSRRNIVYQTCKWKRRKLSFEISKGAEWLSRFMRGAVTQFLIKGNSYDLHLELAIQSPLLLWEELKSLIIN